jgi:cytosine/adenosine deaminase-related metal-dependent hydrolase
LVLLLTGFGAGFAQAGNPFPSTYEPGTPTQVLIVRATILDGTGRRLDDASLLLRDGRIAAIGADLEAPPGPKSSVRRALVTPGIIDPHSISARHPSRSRRRN